jgi:hypothetical protein
VIFRFHLRGAFRDVPHRDLISVRSFFSKISDCAAIMRPITVRTVQDVASKQLNSNREERLNTK